MPLIALLLLASLAMARGQSPRPPRMARLTYLAGQVSLYGSGANPAESQAELNMPILEGTVLSTEGDGQAEVEFEDGSLFRLTPNSALSVVRLSVDEKGNLRSRLALLSGLAYLELRSSPRYQYSVDAQGDEISPLENSTIRISLDQPPAIIAVMAGKVHVASLAGDEQGSQAGAQVDVAAGQTLRGDLTTGRTATGGYLVRPGIDPDSWDQWNQDRDQAAATEAANQTAARNGFAGDQGYGWSDLDANGSWYDLPGQGPVWQPDVAAGYGMAFDPYGYGNWVWTPGFGYVWASGYPWGWTPYRCGSWQYWDSFGWGWWPGSFCGAYGFGGYAFRVNLHHVPAIYHGPRRPIPGPVRPLHPVVHVHASTVPTSGLRLVRSPRTIDGKLIEPLRPIGGGVPQRGGNLLGAALVRDFPIDGTTHQPVLGVLPNHQIPTKSFASPPAAPWRPAAGASSELRPVLPGTRSVYVPPPNRPGGVAGAAPNPGTAAPLLQQQVRPQIQPQIRPEIRTQPSAPIAAPPRYSPAPVYSPPPAPHYYSPPPSAYSPPPAPRYSPPPAPPPSAPRAAPAPAAGSPRGR
ncbi:MAG TPA: DUF6600 domain-containing protein [Granulicella sp.]|nr:DUF6600 domain-containing protein [Granulicella sp.]